MKILVVEDNQDFSIMLTSIIRMAIKDVDILYAETCSDAKSKIEDADLIISDFNFPIEGFPAILPILQEKKRPFILQSSCPSCIKLYDSNLQVASLCKNGDLIPNLIDILKTLNVRFNNTGSVSPL